MNRTRWIAAILVFASSLVFFLTTLCRHYFPVDSAGLLCLHLELAPFAPTDSALWGGLVRLMAKLPFGEPALRFNGLGAALGALSVTLMFWLVSGLPHDRSHEERRSELSPVRSQIFSGLAAAGFLALATNFWLVSTRAFPDSLGIVLLLVWTCLSLAALREKKPKWLAASSLVLGAGCSEYAPFIFLVPVWAIQVLAYCLRSRFRFRWGQILGYAGLALLGYSLVIWNAWILWKSPSAAWRGYDTLLDAVWAAFRQQKILLVKVIPPTGWILIALTTMVPLLFMLLPKDRLQRRSSAPSLIFHLAMTLLAGLIFYPSWISPYAQFKFRPVVVGPYVFTAAWAGYLAGYWWCWAYSNSRLQGALMSGFKRVMRPLCPILLVLAWALLAAANWKLVAPSNTRWTSDYADDMLAPLRGGETLALDSNQQYVLLLKAWERDRKLRIISPALARSSVYTSYVRDLWTDARLRSLSLVGVLPMLSEWIRTDKGAAYFSDFHDGPIHAAGKESIPDAPYFRSGETTSAVEVESLAKNLATWANRPYMKNLASPSDPESPSFYDEEALRYTSSKLANNLGVLCEQGGRNDLAADCYRLARTWHPENASSLLNFADLAARESLPERDAIRAELEEFLKGLSGKLGLFTLAQVHGLIARHEAYIQRGYAWAVSGKPLLAAAEVQRAIQISKDEDRYKLFLAMVQFDPSDPSKAESNILAILEKDPGHIDALGQLARIQAARGDLASARASIARAVELNPELTPLRLQQAGVELLGGDFQAALTILRETTRRDPSHVHAWSLLALVADQVGAKEELKSAERVLLERQDLTATARLTFSQLFYRRGDYPQALLMLEQARRQEPQNPAILEQTLRVLHRQRDRLRARSVVNDLLHIDPGHAFGNLMLGSLQYSDGDLTPAESSFRASLERNPTSEAYNSLAYVLVEKGRFTDALPLVQKARELSPENVKVTDTLAMTYLGLNRVPEALETIRLAVAGAPNNSELLFHLALILEKSGVEGEALAICDDLFARMSQVPPYLQTDLTDLRAKLYERVKKSAPAPST